MKRWSRSREGAWIEMPPTQSIMMNTSRSREGAWIEIWGKAINDMKPTGRSREGAWIEI